MHTLNRSLAWLFALLFTLLAPLTQAQTAAPSIKSFSVDQVAQLSPGTELIFRAAGTAAGTLSLRIDGSGNQIGLVETKPGVYEGAYTISVRDKITYNSKVNATLKVADKQTSTTLAQSLLTDDAQAKAVAAANPGPTITRFESKTTGALSGGNEISFVALGTAGSKASVSLDGGKTSFPLTEEKSGRYTGTYTVKSRDQFTGDTQAVLTLTLADHKATLAKTLAVAAVTPDTSKAAVAAACATCGTVTAINSVKVKGKPNYVGAIAGGVAGAALGSQVGKGDGNTVATVAGAVGGAVAGREIEKKVRETTHFDVVVKMNDGSTKTVRFDKAPTFNVGAKVRVDGNTVVAAE